MSSFMGKILLKPFSALRRQLFVLLVWFTQQQTRPNRPIDANPLSSSYLSSL